MGKELRLNSAVEVVGTLNSVLGIQGEAMDDGDRSVKNLVKNEENLPKLHALAVFKNPALYLYGLGTDQALANNVINAPEKVISNIQPFLLCAREKLKEYLGAFFNGDSLVAEYLILNLVSRVHSRAEPLAVGNFPLNISNIPPKQILTPTPTNEFSHHFHRLLQNIVPRCVLLQLSMGFLEKEGIVPRKDYESNEIEDTVLQLADRSCLVVDETKVAPGPLNEKGFRSLRAIREIVLSQTIKYDFKYQEVMLNTDYPCLILSTTKSLIKETMEVKLNDKAGTNYEAVNMLSKEAQRDLILYLTVVGDPRISFKISPEVMERVKADYVEERTKEVAVNVDMLHNWVTMARLHAVSLGKSEMSMEDYFEVRKLEAKRVERLRAVQ